MAINSRLSFTDQAAAFSAAAAYRINPQVVETWNPYLLRTPRLLVPVAVDALVVRPGEAAQSWAECKLKAADPAIDAPTRYDVLPDPFAELPATRTSGVYLHWALPDALTHADASGDTAVFPAAPDRWLVLRMSPSGGVASNFDTIGLRAVRGWVLRAGDKDPVPIDLDSFVEGPPSQDAIDNPLSVLGTGDVAWSAYYDNCVNRLAFYDPLSDLEAGPLSYLVCGWYSNPAQDPLGDQSVRSLTDFHAKLQQYQWHLAQGELDESIRYTRGYTVAARSLGLETDRFLRTQVANDAFYSAAPKASYTATNSSLPYPEFDDNGEAIGPYTTDGSWWPNATLMHGCIVALGWPSLGWPGNEGGLLSGESGGPPDPSAINVAVGNTLTEALAALVAKHNNLPSEAPILEGFLLGSLTDLEHADGRARLDALLQASAFGSQDGGFTMETINIPAMPDTPPKLPNPVTPGVFAARRAAGHYALAWEAHGLGYGIPADIADDLARGHCVIANVSRAVLTDAAARFPTRILEITAPVETLARRLAARGRETEADIAARLSRAVPLPAGLDIARIDNTGAIEDSIEAVLAVLAAGLTPPA